MKFLTSTTMSLLFALPFLASAAGDKKVKCETTTNQLEYYYGLASCSTFDGDFLSEYVSKSYSQWYTIIQDKYDNGSWKNYRCSSNLPNSAYETISNESCQYTPKASINRHYVEESYDSRTDTTYYAAGVIVAQFTFSDRDGEVQKVEKWVNGQSTTKSHVDITSASEVKLKVTDNDGNVTETSTTVYPPMMQTCSRGGQLILCEGNF
ncbi:hypothetical protein LOS73_14150 [Pseudoalteromonas sp. SCSIO 43210]